MSAADAVFNQIDANQDGRVDLGEYRNFVGNSLGAGWGAGAGWGTGAGWSDSWGAGAGYGAGYGAGWGAGASGYDLGLAGTVGGAYDSSYAVGGGLVGGGLVGGAYDSSYAVGGGLVGTGLADASLGYGGSLYGGSLYGGSVYGGSAYDSGVIGVNQYAADAQGIYQDPNPQIIRRPNPTGVQTYTQNIRVQFLQPPPVPPPGPLVIREVRPPQPPLPPPLRLRQVAPPLPPPPPLVLRERPPIPPPAIASQTVIRRLPGLPVPPRSVIIERVPPPPPRPRDIFMERWVPYGPQAKRRTLLHRAAAPLPYPAPRNVIIQYEQAPARVVRNFQRLGVVSGSPAAYVQTYGASLLDGASLVARARSAGVVEDISAPGYVGYGLGAYGQGWAASSGLVGGADLVDGGLGLGGWNSSLYGGNLGYGYGAGHGLGYGVGHGLGYGGGYGYSAGYGAGYGADYGAGYGADYGLGYGATYGAGYGAGYGGGLLGSSAVVSGADAAFLNADSDYNGSLDRSEFRNLLAQNL